MTPGNATAQVQQKRRGYVSESESEMLGMSEGRQAGRQADRRRRHEEEEEEGVEHDVAVSEFHGT